MSKSSGDCVACRFAGVQKTTRLKVYNYHGVCL